MADTIKCEYCDAVLRNTPRSIGSHVGYHHKETAQQVYTRKVEFTMRCLECGDLVANSNNVLARHVRKVHCMDWPDYEVKHLHGGVVPKCKCGCGQDLMWRKGGFAEYVTGHSSRGVGNPMFGKKGEQNPNTGKRRTGEMRERYAISTGERWKNDDDKFHSMFTPEYRKKLSVHAISLLEQGKIGPQAPYRAEWKLNPFTGREEYMHSSWEARFLDECVERGVPVTKQHGIRIPYVDPNGLERIYVPDFLSLDGRTLYEVKGYETDTDREKWRATVSWCLENNATHEVVQYDRS